MSGSSGGDVGVVAAISKTWTDYQRGVIDIATVATQIRGLSDTVATSADVTVRVSVSTLADDVELVSVMATAASVDRRLAAAMNRFLTAVGEEPVATFDRATLLDLLVAGRDGSISLGEIRSKARRSWLAGLAPTDDVLANDSLFFLAVEIADPRQDDLVALIDYLSARPGSESEARDRFYDYVIQRDSINDGEVGPSSSLVTLSDPDDAEFGASPTQRRLSRAVRFAPESVWAELAERLCSNEYEDELFLGSILEELLYLHADAFIDRLERLAAECPAARERIAGAYVGGVGATPALERFWSLQQELYDERWHESSPDGD
jgi:hypothetical protein